MADPLVNSADNTPLTTQETVTLSSGQVVNVEPTSASTRVEAQAESVAPFRVEITGYNRVSSPPQTVQTALANPLSEYDSYTYGLSLHLLSETQFNNLIANPATSYIPQNVLVASAGKYSNNFKRNPNFQEDFYFDDFQMKTVVNITTRNRNSNLIECSFTIIEPAGFTFINRLVSACQGIGSKNYLKQPYLLQIDFYGYKDGVIAGSPIPNMSKYIPIALVSMKTRVGVKGTEYKIEAVPYNHQAFSQINVVSPANFKIKASTVTDMFGTGQVTSRLTEAFANAQRDQEKIDRAKAVLNAGGALAPEDAAELRQYVAASSGTSGVFQVSGFCDALNSWYVSLRDIDKKIIVTNEYRVEFFKKIGDAKIFPSGVVPNDVSSAAAGGSTTSAAKTAVRAAGALPVGQVSWNSGTFNIPMGMQIDKLIDYAVRNSDYIRNQLVDPDAARSSTDFGALKTISGAPLEWYRIVPKIKIKQYDQFREQYAYEITYCVKPWTVNSKYPYASQGRAAGYVKQYNWMYTGKNTEVIDLQLDFDMLYYQQLTAFRNEKAEGATGEGVTGPDTINKAPPVPLIVSDVLQPLAKNFVSFDYRTQIAPGANPAGGLAGGDLQRDLTSSSRGDMINIQLKIIGDPHLIKQDDLFYAQNISPPSSQLTPNNSLYYDGGELYVNVVFQSPIDYDENTGLAIPNLGNYTYNLFNGIYKIITVENTFRQGKFEQTLDLIRLPVTQQDVNQMLNAKSRIESYVNYGLGQLASLPYSRFTGPRILVNSVGSGIPIYNAGLASAGGGIVSGLVNQFIGKVTNEIIGKVSGAVKDIFSSGGGNPVISGGGFGGAIGNGGILASAGVVLDEGSFAGSIASGIDGSSGAFTGGFGDGLFNGGDQLFDGLNTDLIPEGLSDGIVLAELDLPEIQFPDDFGGFFA
jgi:hypothetical protein